MQAGILRAAPDWEVTVSPVADGGEGTMESIITATKGEIFEKEVHDPLMRKHKARFGITRGGKTAVIEMASASGLEILEEDELDPLTASTYGTGELIREALDRGCDTIIVGMGGSATNDGGTGMLRALGARFLDKSGKEIEEGGGGLCDLHAIDPDGLDHRLKNCEIIAATDVRNPLLGEDGASRVYGPQKGAGEETAARLDRCLGVLAEKTREMTGEDLAEVEGTGAAGGLGFGMKAFLDAEIRNGFQVVAEMTGLKELVEANELVITGEGKIDRQTQYGKTPMGVASLAEEAGKPVIAVAGALGEGYRELYQKGFHVIFPLPDRPMTLGEALDKAPSLLEDLGERIAAIMLL